MLYVNISVFLTGNSIAAKIKNYETEMTQLKKENMEMGQKKASLQSLTYASSVAKQLNFTKEAIPVYLSHTHIAYQ